MAKEVPEGSTEWKSLHVGAYVTDCPLSPTFNNFLYYSRNAIITGSEAGVAIGVSK
jgi:hypothetical protein